MPELPIIVEPTLLSYLLWGALGGGIFFILLYGMWQKQRSSGLAVTTMFGGLPFLAFGIFLMLQPVGWSWRINENGMTLHAPFVPFQSSGSVTWAEVTGMHIVIGHGRSGRSMSYYQLQIDGPHGSVIEFSGLDTMPKSFAAPLVAVVAHYAPHVRLSPDAKGFTEDFAAALGENVPTHDSMSEPILTLSRYRVRIGGRVLK
jgi:hypothetical protein